MNMSRTTCSTALPVECAVVQSGANMSCFAPLSPYEEDFRSSHENSD